MLPKEIIQAATRSRPADVVYTNAKVVDVLAGDVIATDIAVAGGYVIGFNGYNAEERVDLGGRYVAPGFVDAHVHIESAMTNVSEFVKAVLPQGTTAAVADPHEIANVAGLDGINYMLASSRNQPMQLYFTLPSCVPATDMETSGAVLDEAALAPLMKHPRVVALGEMMNFPGVIQSNDAVRCKIHMAQSVNKPIDGHAPGLSGHNLWAYVASGIGSDHECTTADEAAAKLRAGMWIMIREGTGAKNLDDLLPLINSYSARRMMYCTDDRHPHDLLENGHINAMVQRTIAAGIDPILAIQMATINPAEYFNLTEIGAIVPGRRADWVVFSDLRTVAIEAVYTSGVEVAREGRMTSFADVTTPQTIPRAMRVDVDAIDLALAAEGDRVRVIELIPNQITTRCTLMDVKVDSGMAVSDTDTDILKIAVIERHHGTGNVGVGFVKGFGLQKGALASSVAHDSHNIIAVGCDDAEMLTAIRAVVRMGGGMAVTNNGRVIQQLDLPIGGLMSTEPVAYVRAQLDRLIQSARKLGCRLTDPFMALSFLALPVIPRLKLTDKGLVDVERFKVVSVFV